MSADCDDLLIVAVVKRRLDGSGLTLPDFLLHADSMLTYAVESKPLTVIFGRFCSKTGV